ncbi:hypothetical protein C8Q73DRAFT_673004 [Cubamyces lactineus]|nr:hypothetical protein C8Q73DRAFT_673004 [Cubamyces lactineus]
MCLCTSAPSRLSILLIYIYAACLAHGALQYIDNTDVSIKYTGSSWRSLTGLPASFYNNTAAYAASSGLMAQVTFYGCSATVYGALMSGGTSASNRSSSYTLDGVLMSTYWTGPPEVDSYDMPFYDTSQIACATHTLEIRNLGTDFYFDYVEINTPDAIGPSEALITLGRTGTQASTAGTATSSSLATTSIETSGASVAATGLPESTAGSGINPAASSSSAHRPLNKNPGAIAGIAVGGGIALLIIGCGIVRVYRRRNALNLGSIYGFNPLESPTSSKVSTEVMDTRPVSTAPRSDTRHRHDPEVDGRRLTGTTAPSRTDPLTSDMSARSGTRHSVDGGSRLRYPHHIESTLVNGYIHGKPMLYLPLNYIGCT